jgi:hypothetical protein
MEFVFWKSIAVFTVAPIQFPTLSHTNRPETSHPSFSKLLILLLLLLLLLYIKLQVGFYPVSVPPQQGNTQIHLSHKVTPLKKQISSRRYTNPEGNITAKE